jgi:hypothetical protein
MRLPVGELVGVGWCCWVRNKRGTYREQSGVEVGLTWLMMFCVLL